MKGKGNKQDSGASGKPKIEVGVKYVPSCDGERRLRKAYDLLLEQELMKEKE
jgi:hypothetical protein